MKTIELDPFDVKSVNKAIEELEAFEKERENKIAEYIRRLCVKGANVAQNTYGSTVIVQLNWDKDGIQAFGDQVVFLEFGTGIKVQDHPELSKPLPIEIMPGSWSESPEGKHTWSTWLAGGEFKGRWLQRRFNDYPYNTQPRPGMWEAYKAIEAAQEQVANEVFNK